FSAYSLSPRWRRRPRWRGRPRRCCSPTEEPATAASRRSTAAGFSTSSSRPATTAGPETKANLPRASLSHRERGRVSTTEVHSEGVANVERGKEQRHHRAVARHRVHLERELKPGEAAGDSHDRRRGDHAEGPVCAD